MMSITHVITKLLLKVLIRVDLKVISSTKPFIPSDNSIKSPCRIGLSIAIYKAEKIPDKVFCKAKATAKPAIPKPANKALTFTPK